MKTKSGELSLRDIISNKKYLIPMYQRGYKWNSNVVKKLINDIVSCYKINIKKSVGLLTLYEHENVYDIIDGQQRFTTLAIILTYLNSDINIDLHFERDEQSNPIRYNAIFNNENYESTDTNRINRNRETLIDVISEDFADEKNKKILADFILDNVTMLCSVVNNQPMEEFMNLNAYKTGFSVCDYIRANLISLNSFHKTEMEKKDINQILSWSLSNHSYKTAVAVLYNDIQNKLYRRYNLSDGKYKGIYELLIDQKLVDAKIMIIPVYESRINIIFKGLLNKNAEDYSSNEITENFDYWIRMLQKLAYTNRILDELEEELKQGEYHSFKQIDDYQLTTKKSFIIELFEGINSLDEGWDSNTLAKELQKYSNIDSVLIRCLKLDSKKLANRYLEAFVYSSYNEGTNKKADNEIRNNFRLPQMSMKEVVSEISGCGRYIIDRYEREHRDDLNLNITIPPIIDLEDRENSKFGETLNYLNDTDDITVGKLFEYNIMIPVIQRDYCMGARITGENDFLAFLLNGFNKSDKIKASTVLLSVALEENEKTIYIFDGQQRTFTLYNILKYCGESDLKQYKFVGRDINNENEYGSPYSKESVEQLYKVLKNNKIDKKGFAEYIKNNVSLKVKTVDSISGAEQFFMDINGGVKLNKYEIYKALLSNQLSQIGRDDIVRKIENKWLQYFYNFRIEYLQSSNIKSDESDKEEIMEIRFIEYVCRFVYRKNHHGLTYSDIWTVGSNEIYKSNDVSYGNRADKTESELLMFDEIESKSEIVTKLDYVSRLDKDDIVEIETIMDYIVGLKITSGDLELVKSTKVECDLNSTGNKLCFIQLHIESDKKNVLKSSCEYVKRFIWSLDDENRKSIRHYYKYKNISKLRNIYDEDQIIRDIILNIIDPNSIKGDYFPYYICWKNSIINIFGGYHNKKNWLEYRYDKEIPAYYWKDVVGCKDKILREAFLYEKFGTESKNLNLALVENGIKYEDDGSTNIERIEKEIEYEDFRFRFDKDEYWQDFTTRSAYIFRYDAYKVLEKRIVKPK